MTLRERLKELISASFTGVWVQSHEHDDALLDIARLCHDENWTLASWDISQGLSIAGAVSATSDSGQDPLAALRALPAISESSTSTILVLKNFHRFLQSAELVQTMARQLADGKQSRSFLIVL